jgi:hypothetical protein
MNSGSLRAISLSAAFNASLSTARECPGPRKTVLPGGTFPSRRHLSIAARAPACGAGPGRWIARAARARRGRRHGDPARGGVGASPARGGSRRGDTL